MSELGLQENLGDRTGLTEQAFEVCATLGKRRTNQPRFNFETAFGQPM
jgi:hypothetical protein